MNRAALTAAWTASAACASLVAATPAAAHGLVGKQDLPIPRWMFAWSATIVLVISFVGLAALWTKPILVAAHAKRVIGLPALLDPLLGAIGVAWFALLIYAGFAGSQVETANLVPTSVYVMFWVGIPMLSLVFGDVFRPLNPWRAIGRFTGWIVQKAMGDVPDPIAYPTGLGHWPAAIGIFLFACLELVYSDGTDPSHLAALIVAYSVVQFLGMAIFGVRPWCAHGDAFGVYFGLFATLSFLRLSPRAIARRVPLSGTAQVVPIAGTIGLLCVMIGSTSFDGFTSTEVWRTMADWLRERYLDIGLSLRPAVELTFLTGLVLCTAAISALYLLGARGIRTVDRTRTTMELARKFAPSLIPIALAYVLAHYFGMFAYQSQAMAFLVSDPLGRGSDLFGTASATIDYGWISATAIWYVQITVLVLGHAAGLALAHDRALELYGSGRKATQSQYWMLGVMITFTCLALWLLSNVD